MVKMTDRKRRDLVYKGFMCVVITSVDMKTRSKKANQGRCLLKMVCEGLETYKKPVLRMDKTTGAIIQIELCRHHLLCVKTCKGL
jgi:hypothetical protein